MPTGAPHSCGPGCPVRVPAGTAHCPAHTRKPAATRGYDAEWRRVRLQVLREEPLCRACVAEGRITPAQVVDHIRTIHSAPSLRLERSNLRPLCKAHHDRIVTEGDFGR